MHVEGRPVVNAPPGQRLVNAHFHCHHERAQQAALLAGRSARLDIRVVTTALSVRSVALQSCERKRSVELIKVLLQKAVVVDAA